jgi:hypothetical protein
VWRVATLLTPSPSSFVTLTEARRRSWRLPRLSDASGVGRLRQGAGARLLRLVHPTGTALLGEAPTTATAAAAPGRSGAGLKATLVVVAAVARPRELARRRGGVFGAAGAQRRRCLRLETRRAALPAGVAARTGACTWGGRTARRRGRRRRPWGAVVGLALVEMGAEGVSQAACRVATPGRHLEVAPRPVAVTWAPLISRAAAMGALPSACHSSAACRLAVPGHACWLARVPVRRRRRRCTPAREGGRRRRPTDPCHRGAATAAGRGLVT